MKSRSKGQSGKVRQCYLHTLIATHYYIHVRYLGLYDPVESPAPQQDSFDLHHIEGRALLGPFVG